MYKCLEQSRCWISRNGLAQQELRPIKACLESLLIPGEFWPDLSGSGGPGGLQGGLDSWRCMSTWDFFFFGSI